ncbi:MAG: NirD/YgiW/YdeI family stress tolerance protein [Treponema sp.]|nr:NirD/YgiW/YdeI family stress tolerance protein [Treponema sp.]
MKKYSFLVVLSLIVLLFAAAVCAQQSGFTGPSAPGTANGQAGYQAVTVSQLQTLPDRKAYVTLTGNITQSAGRNHYTFRDSTGEITIKIDRHYWWNLSVGSSDRVQLLVKVEAKKNGRIEVEAKGIRKL